MAWEGRVSFGGTVGQANAFGWSVLETGSAGNLGWIGWSRTVMEA